ncbi:MAG: Wzz/FepE/Etk N-terminal domain-containing protein [Halofilum sp. (in: g-proteobacteria)]
MNQRTDRGQPLGNANQPITPRGWDTPDDEISLFDIWDALVRRRWLILGVFALVTLLAAGYALTRPDVYRYQTTIQIGQMLLDTEDGTRREPISTSEATAAQLESNAIPDALRSVYDITPEELATGGVSVPNIQVDAPTEGNIVQLTIEGPRANQTRYLEILRTAAGALVQNEAGVLQTERIRLTNRRERLAREHERVQGELGGIQQRIDRLAASDGENAAVTLRVDGLQQRAGSVHSRLLDIERDRAQAADALAVLEDNAAVFSRELTPETISQQRQSAQRIAAATGGIHPTRIIAAPPEASLTQAGTNGTLILALGAVLGGMLGVFSAFIAEFVSAARRRNSAAEPSEPAAQESDEDREQQAYRLG